MKIKKRNEENAIAVKTSVRQSRADQRKQARPNIIDKNVSLLSEFLTYLESSSNPPLNMLTIRAYGGDIKHLFIFLSEDATIGNPPDLSSLGNIEGCQIESYIQELEANDYDLHTLDRKVSAIRKFFKFLRSEKGMDSDPTEGISCRADMWSPEGELTDMEVKELLDAPPKHGMGIRDRALMELLWATGMHVSELARLGISDINFHRTEVKIKDGPVYRQRTIPVSHTVINELEKYLKFRGAFPKTRSSGAFFLSFRGKPLQERDINRIIARYAQRLWPFREPPITPSLFRQTLCNRLVREGQEDVAQELLGFARTNLFHRRY